MSRRVWSAIPWASTVQGVFPRLELTSAASPTPNNQRPKRRMASVIGRADQAEPWALHGMRGIVRAGASMLLRPWKAGANIVDIRSRASAAGLDPWCADPRVGRPSAIYRRCVADESFQHPRLAAIYDALNSDRSDLDAYVAIFPRGRSVRRRTLEIPNDRPRALARVRDDRERQACARIVHGPERDTRVVPLQEDGIVRRVEPEAQPVALRVLRRVAARPNHLRDPLRGDDPTGEERPPERAQIGGRGVDPAVAAPAHGKMEDVAPQGAVDLDVPGGCPGGELVGAQERRVRQPGGPAHALLDQLVEGHAARALGDERQDDVAGVAVCEALAGRELARVAVEHHEVVLGGRELVDRYGHHVVLDLEAGFLVEVVADARPVRQEVLDRHPVVDHRQIAAEDGAGGRRQLEHAFLDQAHDCE